MLVYKVKNGVNINYYQDVLPDDSRYDEVLGSAEISKSMFKRLAAQNTGNYAALLEACYREQVYNEAVAKTLDSFRTPIQNTPQTNQYVDPQTVGNTNTSAGENNV